MKKNKNKLKRRIHCLFLIIVLIITIFYFSNIIILADATIHPVAPDSSAGAANADSSDQPVSTKTTYKPPAWASTLSKIANYFYSGTGVGPTKTNWYEVEQWEIDACRIWGGASSANRASSGADEVSTITLSQLTASLQGNKHVYPDNTTLYEAAWYIEPITGSVNYKILLINSQGESTVLVPSGSASSSGGSSQYLPIGPILTNATNNFTRIEMRKSDDSLLIRTKIVEVVEG